jgi:hypothetical protein
MFEGAALEFDSLQTIRQRAINRLGGLVGSEGLGAVCGEGVAVDGVEVLQGAGRDHAQGIICALGFRQHVVGDIVFEREMEEDVFIGFDDPRDGDPGHERELHLRPTLTEPAIRVSFQREELGVGPSSGLEGG